MFLCVDRYVYMLDTLLIVFFTYTGIDNPGVCYGFQSKPSGYLKISLYKCILWAIVFSCFVLSIIIFLHLSFSGYRLGNKKKKQYIKKIKQVFQCLSILNFIVNVITGITRIVVTKSYTFHISSACRNVKNTKI